MKKKKKGMRIEKYQKKKKTKKKKKNTKLKTYDNRKGQEQMVREN